MNRKYKLILILSAGLAMLAFGYYQLTQAHKEFLETKYVRETTATVIGKEEFRADQNNRFYVSGYGDRVEMQPVEEQKRVYYQIDNFDHLEDPRRSRVIDAERKRIEEFGSRFTLCGSPGLNIVRNAARSYPRNEKAHNNTCTGAAPARVEWLCLVSFGGPVMSSVQPLLETKTWDWIWLNS